MHNYVDMHVFPPLCLNVVSQKNIVITIVIGIYIDLQKCQVLWTKETL